MSRLRFQYRLRSLLLITAAVGAISAVIGFQLNGRLQTENDPLFFTDFQQYPWYSSGGAPTLCFVCATEDDARNLAARFDREQFCSELCAVAGPKAPASDRVLTHFSVNPGRLENVFFIKYVFSAWGRYRLDARHMAYVFDRDDPVAEARNAAAHRAFNQAAKDFAQRNPVIQRWSQFPP